MIVIICINTLILFYCIDNNRILNKQIKHYEKAKNDRVLPKTN